RRRQHPGSRRALVRPMRTPGRARTEGQGARTRWPGAHRRTRRRTRGGIVMILPVNPVWLVVIAIVVGIAYLVINILREYERGVVLVLGRFQTDEAPGLVILVAPIQQVVRVQLRPLVVDVPSQDVISQDNVSVKVNAVVYYRVV